MHDLLIRNCHALLFADQNQPIIERNQDIAITNHQITSVTPSSAANLAQAQQVIDAHGQLAIPGFINCHAHVPMVLFRGLAEDMSVDRWFNEIIWPVESNLTEEDVYWGMLLGLVEMIEAGVTTVADHYFYMDQAAKAVSEAGTRAALGWAIFASQGEAALRNAARFIEQWHGAAEGRITTWMAPHAPYTCDDGYLRACVAEARRLDVGIHIHASEDKQQVDSSLEKRGITPIRVLEQMGILDGQTLIAHGTGILSQDVELLSRYADHVGIAHCPKTYMKLGVGLTPIRPLRKVGVSIGLGTDGAASNNTMDIWESLRLMALTQKQQAGDPEIMTIGEALEIAFRGSASTVGLRSKIGELKAGCLADIVLVDLSGAHQQPQHNIAANLLYSTRANDVQTVIVNGNVIMQDRKLLTLDKTEIIRQVNKTMDRLAQRIPGRKIQDYHP
ncbi:MAG: amidohydrolase [Caldilineaceae bacterium]